MLFKQLQNGSKWSLCKMFFKSPQTQNLQFPSKNTQVGQQSPAKPAQPGWRAQAAPPFPPAPSGGPSFHSCWLPSAWLRPLGRCQVSARAMVAKVTAKAVACWGGKKRTFSQHLDFLGTKMTPIRKSPSECLDQGCSVALENGFCCCSAACHL